MASPTIWERVRRPGWRKLGAVVLLSLLGIASPNSAGAECVAADLVGDWQVYRMFKGSSPFGIMSCTVSVEPDGSVTAGTFCLVRHIRRWWGGGDLVSGGSISVASDCHVTGGFEFRHVGGYVCNQIFDSARMAGDKLTMSGVGTECSGDGVFQFTAIKR